jgi:hypothetical protein
MPAFSLKIYKNRLFVYQYEALAEKFSQGLFGDATNALGEQDIASYSIGPHPSHTIALLLTKEASTRWRSLKRGETTPFSVSVDDEVLFVGVFYNPIGAAAINTPVIHEREESGCVRVLIGAVQGAAFAQSSPIEHTTRLDHPELRQLFSSLGVLQELPAAPKYF